MEQCNKKCKFKLFFERIVPTGKLRLPFYIMLSVLAGLLVLIIQISNAVSYMSDSPEACINCHVMTTQYATWQHSSHRQVAVCNDCHVPHDNIARKYYFKANDGLRHAFMFTFKLDPQVIQMHEAGQTVVQENCLRCHSDVVEPVSCGEISFEKYQAGEGKLCWECHREVPHGRTKSQSSTPYAIIPDIK